MTSTFDADAALLYGQFVQAAYSMYGADNTNLTPPTSSDFPAGYRMVAWIQMRDFILGSTAPLFYGFVAQNEQTPDQFVMAIRGTSNGIEWWDDANAARLTPFKISGCGMVGDGFARIYDTLEVIECPAVTPGFAAVPRSMRPAGTFVQQVSALVQRHGPVQTPRTGSRGAARSSAMPANSSVHVTGHSLGAALATLYVMENAHTEKTANPTLCTFASPLVGDRTFAAVFNGLDLTSWRVDNAPDLVPKVPPAILGFMHVNTAVPVSSSGDVQPNLACWHSLATYLSLIDPTKTKKPDAACQLPVVPDAKPAPAVPRQSSARSATAVFKPIAIDINHANNVEDTPGPLGGFAKVKASGIAFLLHKATEGSTFADPRYAARRAAWMTGIPVPVTDVTGELLQVTPRFAAYHFLHGQDPEGEAAFFLENARLQAGDDAAVDWETVPETGYIPTADEVDAFCNVVEKALGFPIIVYSSNAAKQKLLGKDARFAKRRLWLAEYSPTWTVQDSWTYPWLWQNNGGQKGGLNSIPGIDGDCDNSTTASPMTVKQLAATWGGGGQQVSKPAINRRAEHGVRPQLYTGTRRKIARYGWKPDLPDQRDYSYAVPPSIVQNISGLVDLRLQCPAVYDQGEIGSCTANAIAGAIEFDLMKQSLPVFTPSRLFIYYNERSIEGTVGSDSGAFIRDGIKTVASQGDCPESEWTYDATPALPNGIFPPGAKAATAPSAQCYTDAIQHKALTYMSVDQNLADMKGCLSSGYPFIFGFTVYKSFASPEVASSGIVPMPTAGEETDGGHAVLAVGYDDSRAMFIVRNSWGPDWGLDGYFYMPYAYLLDDNLANDFWTIRVVN